MFYDVNDEGYVVAGGIKAVTRLSSHVSSGDGNSVTKETTTTLPAGYELGNTVPTVTISPQTVDFVINFGAVVVEVVVEVSLSPSPMLDFHVSVCSYAAAPGLPGCSLNYA
jgi:hypothetical protein